jgi:uncharacterized ferritin-like protein (DUF455 family)
MSNANFFHVVAACLATAEPDAKLRLTRDVWQAWQEGSCRLAASDAPVPAAGRPARPALVRPRQLARRGPGTVEGRAVLFHALTHIEFTAINLALDHACRFRDLPAAYYTDWLRIAVEEVDHFELLRRHLRSLGYDYGDFPAHGGLWEMAQKTEHDALVRMALVPRCLEARGLDVNPGIKARLLDHGDEIGAALLDVILRDEVGHVAAGDRWFRHLCAMRGLEPLATYRELIAVFFKGGLRGPFHLVARREAGFSEDELAYLQTLGPGEAV